MHSHLSGTLTLADVRAGYDRVESGRTVGKLAVDVAAARGVQSSEASNERGSIVNPTTLSQDSVIGPNERIDRLEKKALLSALWLFVFLNHIFRAIHEVVKAEFLTDVINGIYNGVEVTEAMFLLGGIMIAMVPMMWVLPLRASRWANIVIASLHGLTVLVAGAGDLDDYLHASLELTAVALIIWQAWNWGQSRS